MEPPPQGPPMDMMGPPPMEFHPPQDGMMPGMPQGPPGHPPQEMFGGPPPGEGMPPPMDAPPHEEPPQHDGAMEEAAAEEAPPAPNPTIYINNISEKIEKPKLVRGLRQIFAQFGKIRRIFTRRSMKLKGQVCREMGACICLP
jgi:hypothetical protein